MINKWGVFFLISMTLPIIGHVVILPLLLDVVGRDVWISALLSAPIGIIFAYLILHVRKKYPGKHLQSIITTVFGTKFGLIIKVVLALYFLFLSAFSISVLGDMIHISYLPATPIWALSGFFSLFLFYAVNKGLQTITWTAAVLGLIAVMTGHSITIMDASKKDIHLLLPVLEYGWVPILWGVLLIVSIWTELLFLLVIPLENANEKGMFLLWTIGILANMIMILSTSTGVIMIFGLGQADDFTYPALETLRIINIGFIDRFDIYGLILMSFGVYIRSTLYLRLSYETILPKRLSNKKFTVWILAALTIAVYAYSLYIAANHERIEEYTNYYVYTIVLLFIPIMFFLISLFKKTETKL